MCTCRPYTLVQLQAHYNHCGEAASEECLSAATLIRQHIITSARTRTQHSAPWRGRIYLTVPRMHLVPTLCVTPGGPPSTGDRSYPPGASLNVRARNRRLEVLHLVRANPVAGATRRRAGA